MASDCLEVLEEIGKINSGLIAPHAERFLALLGSKNNSLVWGAMAALSTIAHETATTLTKELGVVLRAMENGSVITVDNAVSVLAEVAGARKSARARIEPVLLSHLKSCRAKEVRQHAERSLPAIDTTNRHRFAKALQARMGELTDTQKGRVNRVLRRIEGIG